MERQVCIHCHFYQPPRENPWLEAIEIQDSAYPYHDWNERITAECYATNSASRILDEECRILEIVSNYSRISFNFGPTLLSWMETYTPDVYAAIREADRQSIAWRSGHGNAIAQVYNHIIMPLANRRDKLTQIIWGLRDFEFRFDRKAEGIWLSETAVDIETLELLAEQGVAFTILAPRQAAKVRRMGIGKWKDVSDSRIDPTRPYVCRLPSGAKITIFFYDGPISQGVAFEKILNRGEDFANRLLSGFSDLRDWPQILSIATDGETYGHHHRYGDMALASALNYIESNGPERLTNYGEYLEKYPPTHEVRIFENSSWSCIHGIERWRSDCGCNTGGHDDWNQGWRGPLRNALDWLRDQLVSRYENRAREFLKDPWDARNDYIHVILNRSEHNIDEFLKIHSARTLNSEERSLVLNMLEIQRHAMLMYTSCGWFFDELSGIETVQVMEYAGRAVQLSNEIFGDGLEETFLSMLSEAGSNIPEHGNGRDIYDKFVRPAMIDLKKVAVHYAVSSLFENYTDKSDVFSYAIERQDYQIREVMQSKLAIGRIKVASKITGTAETISFCVIHFGSLSLNGGVRTFINDEAYRSMKSEITSAFESGNFAEIIRLMDAHFGMHNYSLKNLFRDEQRKILNTLISKSLEDFADTYRTMYEQNKIVMGFLKEAGMPIPRAFLTSAEFCLNSEIKKECLHEGTDLKKIEDIAEQMNLLNIHVDSVEIEFIARHKMELMLRRLIYDVSDVKIFLRTQRILNILKSLSIELNPWQLQNLFYRIAVMHYSDMTAKAKNGDEQASEWIRIFRETGDMLWFNMPVVLPEQ